jgi:heme oxygenase
MYCESYINPKKNTMYKMLAIGVPKEIKEQTETLTEQDLTNDMHVFIDRLVKRLAPLEGLDKQGRGRALEVQTKWRKELERVFLGEGEFNDWFDKTRQEVGMHPVDFTKIIYECLQGLQSPEAKGLREQYEVAVQNLGRIY